MTNFALQLHQQLVTYSPYLVGLAGVPIIRQCTSFVYVQFKLPKVMAPVIATLLAVVFNIVGGHYLGVSLFDSVMIGLGTAFGSGLWHELSTN